MSLTVRPILFTEHTAEYLTILEALGMRVLLETTGWTVLAARAGRVAMHSTMEGRVSEGTVHLGFETSDLAGYAAAVQDSAPADLEVALVEANQGPAVQVKARDGLEFFVDSPAVEGAEPECPVIIEPLWITDDVPGATADLQALGLRLVMSNLDGRVTYLRADDGQVLTHVADWGWKGALFAVDCVGDIRAVHAALLAAGIQHDVIDETHGTTLKVPMPGTEETFWVSKLDAEPVGVARHEG